MPKLSLNASKKTKHTPAGEIPVDWGCVQMKDCAGFVGGSQPPQSTFIFEPKPGYVRLLQIRDYKSDRYPTYIPEELSKRSCNEDDIMIGRYGPPIFQILRGKRGSYNVALIKAVPTELVDKEYLYLLLKQDSLFQLIDTLSARTSGQTGIDMDALKTFPVPLPPLIEQRRIAEIIGTWDRAIETLESLIAAKERRKQALMQQLLTGRKRLPGFNSKWKQAALSDVFERVTRPIEGIPEHVLSITAGKGFVDQRKKFSRLIAGKNLERYVLLKKGEFAYNKGNSDRFPQGCIYRLEEVDQGAVPNVYYSFRKKSADIDEIFFKHFFLAGMLNTQLTGIINAGVRNDGLLNVAASAFFDLLINFPTKEEQTTLGLIFETSDRELAIHRKHLESLRSQKRGLMGKLLTGEVRVRI